MGPAGKPTKKEDSPPLNQKKGSHGHLGAERNIDPSPDQDGVSSSLQEGKRTEAHEVSEPCQLLYDFREDTKQVFLWPLHAAVALFATRGPS